MGGTMEQDAFKVCVIEDDVTERLLLRAGLSKAYDVSLYESAELFLDCYDDEAAPDLFLLDVGLPGMDGYELCRQLRADRRFDQTHVVFISAHEDLEHILAGYDAGGEDYIVKPVDLAELKRKIENLRRIARQQQDLQKQAENSGQMVQMLLASLSENSVLIDYLRALCACHDYVSTANAVIGLLDTLQLNGAVQVRSGSYESTFSKAGENWPLEVAVVNHVRQLGRFFQFKQRVAYNFENCTLVVTNMPVDDDEKHDRLLDVLSVAAECANDKITSLCAMQDSTTWRSVNKIAIDQVTAAMNKFTSQHDLARYEGTELRRQFFKRLMANLAELDLSEKAEAGVINMVEYHITQLIKLYDYFEEGTQLFTDLVGCLEGKATPSLPSAAPKTS